MAKRGKRAKKKAAQLRKKLGFLPKKVSLKPRFGSIQDRVEVSGKANRLDKSKREIQLQLDRKSKQRGWDH